MYLTKDLFTAIVISCFPIQMYTLCEDKTVQSMSICMYLKLAYMYKCYFFGRDYTPSQNIDLAVFSVGIVFLGLYKYVRFFFILDLTLISFSLKEH